MSDLLRQLAEAKARVAQLERQIKGASCRELGHDWRLTGGANAACSDFCNCSVEVYTCTRCGECDHGENPGADDIRERCEDLYGKQED